MTELKIIKESTDNNRKCPLCGNDRIVKSGTGWKGRIRYVCKTCWRTFYLEETTPITISKETVNNINRSNMLSVDTTIDLTDEENKELGDILIEKEITIEKYIEDILKKALKVERLLKEKQDSTRNK